MRKERVYFTVKKDKDKKGGSKKQSLTATGPGALTPAEQKKLARKKKRMTFDKLTQNEVENIYVLPNDDLVSTEERRELKNRYYLTVSGRFRVATWISVLLFAVYLGFMFFAYRDDITIENFRFLMRNVNFRLESAIPSSDRTTCGVIYTRDDNRVFAVYKDYFATVGNKRLVICDNAGNKAYNEKNSYSSPVLKASENYLLCFDRGGKNYSLYTYFNNIGEWDCEYPITDAAVSDSGYYAVATRDQSHFSVINVYNDRLKQIQKIMKNKYTTSVDIKSDGSELLVASFYTDENGQPITEIAVHPTDSTDARYTLTLRESICIEAAYLSDGSVAVICRDGVRFINNEGKIYKKSTFSGSNVLKYAIGCDAVTIVCGKASGMTSVLRVISASGESSADIPGTPIAVAVGEEDSAVILSDRVYICMHKSGKIIELGVKDVCDVLWKDGLVYLCGPSEISVVDPSK